MAVDVTNVKLYMVQNSVRSLDISDEEYFSSKYGKYVSNSKLKYLNEAQGGNPESFFGDMKFEYSPSLELGSAVHELVLQPDDFVLGPKIGLPKAKLGAAAKFAVARYLKGGIGIRDAVVFGCKRANYYVNQIDKHVDDVFDAAKKLYIAVKSHPKTKKEIIWLDDAMHDKCEACVAAIKKNKMIQASLNPINTFGAAPSYNELALFVDFVVMIDEIVFSIPVKLKLDGLSVDEETKTIWITDLKTTSGIVNTFMNEGDHFDSFHYARQMALYLDCTKCYFLNDSLMIEKYNVDDTWQFRVRMGVVSTGNYDPAYGPFTKGFDVPEEKLQEGREEYQRLLKEVGYYMIKDGKKI